MKRMILLLAAISAALSSQARSLDIIPAPQKVVFHKGECDIDALGDLATIPASISKQIAPEGYEIVISQRGITIRGGDDAGVFYARQTLGQMRDSYGSKLPCCRIKDAPRYPWRGFMLDESRHFHGAEYVKKTLEQMTRFKLNKFHWHLTDSQGWRIQIDAYPALTEVGGIGNNSDRNAECRYYTKDQIRDIVSYAASLNIEIIPEIDMPGHATAANRAYPEHSGGAGERYPHFTFNVGREETYAFLETVLREVAGLFPSKYLHLGADEVFFGNSCWNDNPDIQALIKREGLDGLKGAEGYFVRRMAAFVLGLGKTPVLWDDALDVGIGNDCVIMWWRHDNQEHLHKALSEGYATILCPRLPCYFDYVQAEHHTQGPMRAGHWNPTCNVYMFPENSDREGDSHTKTAWNLTDKEKANILGLQANLWTERVQNRPRADFMTWPRLCALAEAAWSRPEVKDYTDFTVRMDAAFRYLKKRGVYYFDFRKPERTPEPIQPARYNKK